MAESKQTEQEGKPLLTASGDTEVDTGPGAPISAIALMVILNFLGSMGFSIVLPSLWPFIKSLGGAEILTGWAVAVNSAGTLLSSPIFGYWSDKRGFGEVLAVSLAIGVVANVTYAVSYATWMLLLARFLCVQGNNSILNSYLAYATRKENRTLIYAVNSASGVLGFILGPAVAAMATFKVFQFDIKIGGGRLEVNELRSPGYLSASMLFLCVILLIFFFKEVRRPKRQKSVLEDGTTFIPKDLDAIPLLTIVVLIFFNFSFTAVFTILETIGTPYTTEYFGWNVADNSWMWTGIALAAVAVIFGLQMVIHHFMSHMHYERILLMVAQVVLVAATALLAENSFNEKPRLWKFLAGIAIGTLGYSMTTVLTISLFSKILEGHEQGTWMGIFNASGGLARVVAPILGAYALKYSGGRWVFVPSFTVAVLSFIANVVYWKRLTPRMSSDATNPETVSVKINE